MTLLKWPTPKNPLWYKNLGIISYRNRVIANTAIKGPKCVFNESGRSPTPEPLSNLVLTVNDHQRLTISIIGRQSEGSLIRGSDNLVLTLTLTLALTLTLTLGLSIVRT